MLDVRDFSTDSRWHLFIIHNCHSFFLSNTFAKLNNTNIFFLNDYKKHFFFLNAYISLTLIWTVTVPRLNLHM